MKIFNYTHSSFLYVLPYWTLIFQLVSEQDKNQIFVNPIRWKIKFYWSYRDKNENFIDPISLVWNNKKLWLLWIVYLTSMWLTILIGKPIWNFFLKYKVNRYEIQWNMDGDPPLILDFHGRSTRELKLK